MKRLLVILVSLLCSLQVFSQVRFYTFNSLDGLEDKDDNSHLFYRKYYLYHSGANHSEENGIYRYDVIKDKDTLIAADYWHYNPVTEWYQSVSDISFFDGNPYAFIYCGDKGSMESYAYIFKSDSGFVFGGLWLFVNRIEVSKQNPQRVFASTDGGLILSSDGGKSWPVYNLPGGFSSSKNFFLLSTFPQDDKIMFGLINHDLVKSLDTGNTYTEVDTATWKGNSRFYHDLDGTHIYGCSSEYDGSTFVSVSDKNGDAFSWKKIWESDRKVFISVDQSLLVGPLLYLADGKNIYLSSDYGKTFSHYRKLDRNIVGIYKKPFTNFLYAATKYNLFEITSNETKIIKSLPISPETFSYYPLAVGNKWNFNILRREYLSVGYKDETGIMTREVIGDTLLPNGNKYFMLEEKEKFAGLLGVVQLYFERLDSTTGKIYRYASDNQERVIEELTAEIGDTLELYRYQSTNTPQVIYERNQQKYFGDQILDQKIYHFPNSLFYSNYALTKGIGLDSLSTVYDLGYFNFWLKGCVINGKVMGDTSLIVGIKNENNDTPTEFSLSQNYPNPFNPETVISYQLAVPSKVQLKIHDILGREILTLVNEYQNAGIHHSTFSALNNSLPSGVYYYTLTTSNYTVSKKMMYLK